MTFGRPEGAGGIDTEAVYGLGCNAAVKAQHAIARADTASIERVGKTRVLVYAALPIKNASR